jgi:dipeptidyl aminopeptidase/acylaminoacyl peptidase
MRTSLGALVFFLAVVAATVGDAGARPLHASDVPGIVRVSSPAISPDGKRAVVVVTRVVWNDDSYTHDLDLIDIATHARRTLTYARKGLSDPAFSPDGTKIAFIADAGTGDDAKSQVWVMPLDGGDARPVTDAPDGVEQFAWRPDGDAFAYAAADAKPTLTGAAKFRDSFVFTTEPIVAREEPRPVHLFVVAASGGHARQLTFGTQSVATGEAQSTLSWSPDGKTLAYLLAPNAILNDADRAHVVLLDVASGKGSALTAHDGFELNPLFAPDGSRVAYLYSAGDNQSNLTETYVTTPGGGAGVAVSHPFDRNVRDAAWLADSSGLYFVCGDETSISLVRAPLSGMPERVDLGGVEISSTLAGAIARDGTLVFSAAAPKVPSELYVRHTDGTVDKLTDYNAAIAALDLATPERITYPTTLGIPGDAVLLKPPGFESGKRYPLVVLIHGGPTASRN